MKRTAISATFIVALGLLVPTASAGETAEAGNLIAKICTNYAADAGKCWENITKIPPDSRWEVAKAMGATAVCDVVIGVGAERRSACYVDWTQVIARLNEPDGAAAPAAPTTTTAAEPSFDWGNVRQFLGHVFAAGAQVSNANAQMYRDAYVAGQQQRQTNCTSQFNVSFKTWETVCK
jgi:hypothetical protein